MPEQQQNVTNNEVVIVHSDSYSNWVFDPSRPTQGRRFVNGYRAIQEKMSNRFDIGLRTIEPRPATRAELAVVHTGAYISKVIDNCECDEWKGQRKDLAELAQIFVGGTLVAVDELLSGRAFTAVHLPGAKHHAQADHSSGFCVFADFAIAAKVAVAHGLRVAIFDFDAHHGDGTENLCANDPNILTYSIHERGLFPGTGLRNQPSKHVYNKAIEPGDGMDDQIALVQAASEFARLAIEFGADIIFIAAGADGHFTDPLSHLSYHEGILIKVFGNIFHHSELAKLPVLIGGAGGYCPDDATPSMWAETVEAVASRRVFC